MKKFTVYGRSDCPWCDKVRALLDGEGYAFDYIDLTLCPNTRAKLIDLGFKSVPQVQYDGSWLGGFENTREHLRRMRYE